MKKLSELGISPAPWSLTPNNLGSVDVTAKDSTVVVAYDPPFEEEKDFENKHLIAAAPKLYDLLWQSTNFIEHTVQFVKDPNIENYLKKIALENRAALAEAAGEEVDDGR